MENNSYELIILLKKDSFWYKKIMNESSDIIKYKFTKAEYTLSCNIFLKNYRINKNSKVLFLIFDNGKIQLPTICATLLENEILNRTLILKIDNRDINLLDCEIDDEFLTVCKTFYTNHEYLIDYNCWCNKNEKIGKSVNLQHDKKIQVLNKELFKLRSDALHEYKEINNKYNLDKPGNYLASFHGYISRLKQVALDLNKIKYESFDGIFNAYYDLFLFGFENIKRDRDEEIFKNETLNTYIKLFLERDFYRHIFSLSREKVGEDLTEIYFGKNYTDDNIDNIKALFIKTRLYNRRFKSPPEWESHYHQITNAPYTYYSIKHLLTEGIVLRNERKFFRNIEEFYNLENLTETPDEYEFLKCYLNYIDNFDDKSKIPLLIPQFRFDKEKKNHKYRLDFLIMNYNTYPAKKIGIELSRTQTHINEADRQKRNSFFEKYGITILEFTELELSNIKELFKTRITPFLVIE